METEFVIKAITRKQYSEFIELKLQKYVPPQPQPKIEESEPEPPEPDPMEVFVPENDEEKIAFSFIKVLKKLNPKMFPTPRPRTCPTVTCSVYSPPSEGVLPLSSEEYKKIGSPGLGQRIMLKVSVVKIE